MSYTQRDIDMFFQGAQHIKAVAERTITQAPKSRGQSILDQITKEVTTLRLQANHKGFIEKPKADEVFWCCVLSLAIGAIVLVWGMQ